MRTEALCLENQQEKPNWMGLDGIPRWIILPGADDTEGLVVCEAPYHQVVGMRLDLPGGFGACFHGIMIAIVATTFGGITP